MLLTRPRWSGWLSVLAGCLWLASAHAAHPPASSIPASNLVEPSVLAQTLSDARAPHPLVLQVGSRVLYAQAHIAGAEYVGAAGTDEGLAALRARVASVPKDAPIVLYCGCCPWSHCPNIAEAFAELRGKGYTHVQALHIDNDFGTNWVDQGYPTAKGE